MAKLTEKQKRFVEEYLVDLNATQAAIRAGYSINRASELGYQLLQKTTVSDAIQSAMKKRQNRTEITQDMVLKEIGKVAFHDAGDCAESELKYSNKLKALELLGKHLGMFDKPEERRPDMEEDDNLYQAIAEAVKNEI